MGKTKKFLAWHFINSDGTLNYDLAGKQVEKGQTLRVDPSQLDLCNYGLHASKRAIDALKFAPGTKICRVEMSGKVLEATDKVCASSRKVLWVADAEKTLHLFACKVAHDVLIAAREAGREPDPRSFAAIEAKQKYLNGDISAAELSAAQSAAWSATWSAADSAACGAAWSAAESAAQGAACGAARRAACGAAQGAACVVAWSAACGAAESRQNKILTKMLLALNPAKQTRRKSR